MAREEIGSDYEASNPPFQPEPKHGGGTATAVKTKPRTAPPRLDRMPLWRVLLHNDDVNEMAYVVETIVELTPLAMSDAVCRMMEAHDSGLALLTTTHQEHAELMQEQFMSKQLVVTIEPEVDA